VLAECVSFWARKHLITYPYPTTTRASFVIAAALPNTQTQTPRPSLPDRYRHAHQSTPYHHHIFHFVSWLRLSHCPPPILKLFRLSSLSLRLCRALALPLSLPMSENHWANHSSGDCPLAIGSNVFLNVRRLTPFPHPHPSRITAFSHPPPVRTHPNDGD